MRTIFMMIATTCAALALVGCDDMLTKPRPRVGVTNLGSTSAAHYRSDNYSSSGAYYGTRAPAPVPPVTTYGDAE